MAEVVGQGRYGHLWAREARAHTAQAGARREMLAGTYSSEYSHGKYSPSLAMSLATPGPL